MVVHCSTVTNLNEHRQFLGRLRNRCGWWLLVVPLLWLVETEAFGHQPAVSQISELAAQALELEQTGKFEEALPLRQQAYDLSLQQHGEKDFNTLPALDSLIKAHQQAEHLTEAMALLDRAFHLIADNLGTSHSNYAGRVQQWLSLYFELASTDRRFARGREIADLAYHRLQFLNDSVGVPPDLLEKALQVDPEAFLEGDSRLLGLIWSSVLADFDLDRVKKALPWLEKVQQVTEFSDVDKSERTRIELATVYLLTDYPDEALLHFEKALKFSIRNHGETRASTLGILLQLADTHLLLGNADIARSHYEKIVALDAQRPLPDETGFPGRFPDLLGIHIAVPSIVFRVRPQYLELLERLANRRADLLGKAHPFYPINLDIKAGLLEERGSLERLGYQTYAKRCYRQASRLYKEALELRKKQLGAAHRDTLASLDHLGSFYLGNPFHPNWMFQPEKTLQRWNEALQLRSASLGVKHPETLVTLASIGTILSDARLNRPAEALPYLEKAHQYTEETLGESNSLTLRRLDDLTEVYNKLGRIADSVPLMEKVVTRALAAGKQGVPVNLPNLAALVQSYFALGRHDKALSLLTKVFEHRTRNLGETHIVTLESLRNLAEAYLESDRPGEALPLLERMTKTVIDLLNKILVDPVSSIDQLPVVEALLDFPATKASIDTLNEVDYFYKTIPRHLANLAVCYLLLDRPDDANPLIEQLKEPYKSPQKITTTWVAEGLTDSRTMLDQVKWKRNLFQAEPILLSRLREMADRSFRQERPYLTTLLLKHLVNNVEDVRRRTDLTREDRQALFSEWVPSYKQLSRVYAQQNRPADAFRIAELSKARTLLESATTRQTIQSGVLSSADRAQLDGLETKLHALDNAIGQHREQRQALTDLLIEKDLIARNLGGLNRELTAKYPRYRQLSDVSIIEAGAGQALLPADAALLSYLFQDDELVVFVLTGEGLTAKTLTVPHLKETLRAYRGLLSSATKLPLDDDWKPISVWRMTDGSYTAAKDPPEGAQPAPGLEEIGRYLAEQLLVPVLDNLQGKRHWIIAPDGPLLSLPFETLRLGEQLVVAQHDLSYTQSLSMYATVQARAHEYAKLSGRKSLLAVGAAEYQPSQSWMERGRQLWMDLFAAWRVGEKGQTSAQPTTQTPVNRAELADLVLRGGDRGVAQAFERLYRIWPNIPSALEDIQTLGRLFPDAALYTGEHATEAQLQALNQTRALAQYRYLLFATHGYLHPDYPFLNAIVLGQLHNPPGTDGYVIASEWAGYQLQSDLMVLSACDTGLGQVVPGEGILGLPFAMYVAGNTNVVMSLWKVFDRSTADFMARFFERLKMGVSQVRALNDTKREFLADKRYRDYRRPVFWAPFVLYGV